jgi:glucose/arabinose dehydrogenase
MVHDCFVLYCTRNSHFPRDHATFEQADAAALAQQVAAAEQQLADAQRTKEQTQQSAAAVAEDRLKLQSLAAQLEHASRACAARDHECDAKLLAAEQLKAKAAQEARDASAQREAVDGVVAELERQRLGVSAMRRL